MKLILASNSPRRKDILQKEGFSFEIVKSGFDEGKEEDTPRKTAMLFAYGKAASVFDGLKDKNDKVVLGADTIVVFDGKIIGKPKDEADAKKTLSMLSAGTHEVYTGYCIISENDVIVGVDLSKVTFNSLSEKLIDDYVASKKPLDKAGSYGIQDGYPIVKEYSGSLNNIIGLPIEKIKPYLIEIGVAQNKKQTP